MKRELATTNERGQLDGRSSVNSGKASQLARWLADELGIPGLARLSEDDADRLVERLNDMADEATEAGYSSGWDEAMNYNSDMATLHRATARTEH